MVSAALGRSPRGKTGGTEMLSQGWNWMTSQYPFQPCNSVITASFENPLAVFLLANSRHGVSAPGHYASSGICWSWFLKRLQIPTGVVMHLPSSEPWKGGRREFKILWPFLV